MTIKEYLGQGSHLEQRIFYHARKLDELKAARFRISGPRLTADRVQSSPSGDARFVGTLELIEEMEEQIRREIDTLTALKAQIEDTIRQLLRMDYQLLLFYRYLDGMSWEEIGSLLHVSVTTIYTWHKKALSLLQMPENPICIQKSEGFCRKMNVS